MTSDHLPAEQHEPTEAGGMGTAMPGAGTADEEKSKVTGATEVRGPAGGATYGDGGRATAASLDGTPDENS